MSYVDLHCHLLPGVDDGPQSLDETIAYAHRLAAEGVREVVATPHVNHAWPLDPLTVPDRVDAVRRALDEEGLPIRLRAGGELSHLRAAELGDRELSAVAQGPPGASWLLLEAPFDGIDRDFVAVAWELRARGHGLVIAHPERSSEVEEAGLRRLGPLLAECAVLQVDVCSLLGDHGLGVQETAVRVLRAGHAYLLASDAHPGSRDHTLRLGFQLALRAGASSVQAWRLTQANPRFLVREGIPRVGAAALACGDPAGAHGA